MDKVYIYGLWDPRTCELRYIGKAKNLKDRFRNHIRLAYDPRFESHHNYRWIRQLLAEGIKPEIEILEECAEDNWKEIEQIWIADCRKFGLKLTNMTKGGDSFPDGYIPHNKGKAISEEHKQRISIANTGRIRSEETIKKLRESHLGKKLSEAQKVKIGEKSKGRSMSYEARQKISLARKGKFLLSDEQKQRLSEVQKGKKLSEEHKRKISEAGKGRKHTEETKAKLRAIHLAIKLSKQQLSNEN